MGAPPPMVRHANTPDAAREFAYQEKDGASLSAARAAGWTVGTDLRLELEPTGRPGP